MLPMEELFTEKTANNEDGKLTGIIMNVCKKC